MSNPITYKLRQRKCTLCRCFGRILIGGLFFCLFTINTISVQGRTNVPIATPIQTNQIEHIDSPDERNHKLPLLFGRILFLGVLMSLLAINTTKVQATVEDLSSSEVRMANVEGYIAKSTLHVSFDIELHGKYLSTGELLHIQPVYCTDTDVIRLPKMLVNGKQRTRLYRHEQAMLTDLEKVSSKPYAVVVRNNKKRQLVSYTYQMPIPKGTSKKGLLHIEELLQDCCNLTWVQVKICPIEYR